MRGMKYYQGNWFPAADFNLQLITRSSLVWENYNHRFYHHSLAGQVFFKTGKTCHQSNAYYPGA